MLIGARGDVGEEGGDPVPSPWRIGEGEAEGDEQSWQQTEQGLLVHNGVGGLSSGSQSDPFPFDAESGKQTFRQTVPICHIHSGIDKKKKKKNLP